MRKGPALGADLAGGDDSRESQKKEAHHEGKDGTD
jgi:hypothetical protein